MFRMASMHNTSQTNEEGETIKWGLLEAESNGESTGWD